MDKHDIYWVAGLLEGEGSFTSKANKFPRVTCEMTDEDVIKKLHSLLGGQLYKPTKRQSHWKQSWQWTYVKSHEAAAFMQKIYPYMGERRKKQIDNTLKKWHQYQKQLKEKELHYLAAGKYYKRHSVSLRAVAKKYNIAAETVRKYALLV